MINSVASRIYRSFLITGLIYTIGILSLVDFIYDDMDETLLTVGMEYEQAFYYQKTDGHFQTWHSATVVASFVPDTLMQGNYKLPEIFQGMAPPFQDEIEYPNGQTFLATVKKYSNGTLYIAKDVTMLEQREEVYYWYLFTFAALLILFVFILSYHLSKGLSKPLVKLAERISLLEPGLHTSWLPEEYKDRELQDIARTMNKFLEMLEEYIRREKSLIGMASHELRTPIAVISGAVEIIENRENLTEEDNITLARIKKTTDEMRLNVEALLMLARGTLPTEAYRPQVLKGIVENCIAESVTADCNITNRIQFDSTGKAGENMVDSALAHLLFRNLIENALKHTAGRVWISFGEDRFIILDEGEGMCFADQIKLTNKPGSVPIKEYSGLGLYIATLICDHMEWEIKVSNMENAGARIDIVFHS